MKQIAWNHLVKNPAFTAAIGATSALLILLMFVLPVDRSTAAIAGIPGRYVVLSHLRPHSRDIVNLDIYADFNCAACQALENDRMEELRRHFGGRLTVRMHYLTPSSDAGSALVLYQLAQRAKKGELVAKELFAARLKHATDATNLPTVRKIARKYGIEADFNQVYAAGGWRAAFQHDWERAKGQVIFFPFVVVDGQIATDADVENLESIIQTLLAAR